VGRAGCAEAGEIVLSYPLITHVAIRFRGTIYSLPKPNRHHDVIRKIVDDTGADTVDARDQDQGFLDASGRYLTRRQALRVAILNDQLREGVKVHHRELCSENLW
jgi:hypothetical protein